MFEFYPVQTHILYDLNDISISLTDKPLYTCQSQSHGRINIIIRTLLVMRRRSWVHESGCQRSGHKFGDDFLSRNCNAEMQHCYQNSICPPVTRVLYDKTKEHTVLMPYETSISLALTVMEDVLFSLNFFGQK